MSKVFLDSSNAKQSFEVLSNVVAFSEYMNFITINLYWNLLSFDNVKIKYIPWKKLEKYSFRKELNPICDWN